MTVLNRFGRPAEKDEKPELWLSPEALRAAEAEERRRHEEEVKEQMQQITPEQEKRVLDRFKVMDGQVLIRKRKVAKVDSAGFARSYDEVMQEQEFEQWGTILAVGGKFQTDWGVVREPDPEWIVGRRVMFHPASRRDIDLPIPGTKEKMSVCLVGFMSIYMVDRGEETAEVTGSEGAINK